MLITSARIFLTWPDCCIILRMQYLQTVTLQTDPKNTLLCHVPNLSVLSWWKPKKSFKKNKGSLPSELLMKVANSSAPLLFDSASIIKTPWLCLGKQAMCFWVVQLGLTCAATTLTPMVLNELNAEKVINCNQDPLSTSAKRSENTNLLPQLTKKICQSTLDTLVLL